MLTNQLIEAKQMALEYLRGQGAFMPQANQAVTSLIGIGIGEDNIRIYAKNPEAVWDMVRDVFREVNTEIVITSGFEAAVQCGVSIGHPNIAAGTLGCLVQDAARRHRYILSNNHVLADRNNAALGDPILQPGPIHGGTVSVNTIAKLTDFEALNIHNANFIDAAIAELYDIHSVTPDIIQIGFPAAATVPASVGLNVHKHGLTTQYTTGVIRAVSVDTYVNFGAFRRLWFENQIEIGATDPSQPFSKGGDSGSLILTDPDNNPVGLLFACDSYGTTLANPIDDVLNRLRVVF
ncbi:hypothetical protein F4Y93_00900 [Candidatus Poribacteria bacterium]|nr:hypothetical protein [Candidatus Poribacteria bacterium]